MVTGGAGFIGSNVVDKYIQAGHDVVVVDDLSSGKLPYVHPEAKLYVMNIQSAELEKVFEIEKPDVVNHHAAQKSVPYSVENPKYDAEINVMGLLNVLTQCIHYNVRKIIFISSGGALAGDAPVIPTDETFPPTMISPYAIHKYIAEKYLHFYHMIHGLNYTVLRYANVYGPRQIPDGECGVIPIFMNNLLANRPSTLFAYANQPRGTTRDYVYVEDVCEANLLCLTRGDNEILNIGSGVEIHTEDVYLTLADMINRNIPLQRAGERVGDVRRSVLDCSKALKSIGWKAITPLETGIQKTLNFYNNQVFN